MVNIADVAKGSVINNENIERNFNFGASKLVNLVIHIYKIYCI